MSTQHECLCTKLPSEWGRCGKLTESVWSTGCDGKMQDRAREHLGFPTRFAFIEWAAANVPGALGVSSGPGSRERPE